MTYAVQGLLLEGLLAWQQFALLPVQLVQAWLAPVSLAQLFLLMLVEDQGSGSRVD